MKLNKKLIVLKKSHVEDSNLSYKAKGIMEIIILYENITIQNLINFKKDGKKSVLTGIQELIKFEYIERL